MGVKQSTKKLYSIGEVSRICNVSKKALRFYDQIGVISPDMVSEENNYRYYSRSVKSGMGLVNGPELCRCRFALW